jgi:hypothetical protein
MSQRSKRKLSSLMAIGQVVDRVGQDSCARSGECMCRWRRVAARRLSSFLTLRPQTIAPVRQAPKNAASSRQTAHFHPTSPWLTEVSIIERAIMMATHAKIALRTANAAAYTRKCLASFLLPLVKLPTVVSPLLADHWYGPAKFVQATTLST